MCVVKGSCYK